MTPARTPHRNRSYHGKNLVPVALFCLLLFLLARVDAGPSPIEYGKAGTWLTPSQQQTVLLENRRLNQTLAQVAMAATASASSSLIPALLGISNPAVYWLTHLTALALPGIYLYRNLSSESHQWLRNPITIADAPTLSHRMTLVLERNREDAIQQLIFRQSPSVQNLRSSSTDVKKEHPLNRLSRILTNLGCDHLSLHWFGQHHPHLQITLSGEYYKTLIINVSEWGPALATQAFAQTAPAILNLLHPKNLERLGTLLSSAHQHRKEMTSGRRTNTGNNLVWQWSTEQSSYLRFSPDTSQPEQQLSVEPLTGQRLGSHYWLPLSARNHPTSLLWSFSLHDSTVFPATGEPLMLHTRLTESIGASRYTQAITLKPWQTDLLAMVPYSALYLLMDYLLRKGLYSQMLAIPPSIIGTILGAWFGGSDGGRGNPSYPDKSSSTDALFFANQQALIAAIEESGAPQPVSGIYQAETTQEATLIHQGNNCFFNATLSYMAHTLTDDQLENITSNRYITAKKFKALPEKERAADQKLRSTFVKLMREIQRQASNTPADHPSDKNWETAQKNFQQALFNYVIATNDTALRSVLLEESRTSPVAQSTQDLCQRQSDAHEFLMALRQTFRLESDQSNSVILGSEREIHAEGQVATQIDLSPNVRDNTLSVSIPSEGSVRHRQISDIDGLINRSFLHKSWIDSEDNLFYIPPQRARKIRIKNREVRKHGGMFPFYDQALLAHDDIEELEHINVHLKLYESSGKLNGVGHRLLHGRGTIHLPVQSTGDKSLHTITMEPSAMILHHGPTMHSGHYITAVYRDDRWFIHDDLTNHTTEIKPTNTAVSYGKTPLDLLSSYLENNNLDPYIINYRRIDTHP